MITSTRLPQFLSFCLALVLAASCAKNPVTGKRQLAISEEKEIEMGAAYDPQIVATMGVYEDAELQALINRLGQEMAVESHRPKLNWTFRIVDSDVVNAFAVPGGYVYFTRGILAHFNNEAEFAGVLGHEIGHVTARHTAASMRRQQLAQVGMIAGALASNTVRQNFDAVSQGMQLLMLKYGRDAESQSDRLGVEYSSQLGYDANYMAGFFKTIGRLQDQAGVDIPSFLSTHPDPANREQNVKRLANEWAEKLPGAQDKVNRDGYLRMIDGIIYGEDPKQGYVENGVFYHPVLKFQFRVPNGFRLANSPQAVQMQSEQGDAAVIFTLAQGETPEAAARAWAQQNQLQPQRGGATTVNGMSAYELSGRAGDGQQSPLIDYAATFISYGGNIYNFTTIAAAQRSGAYANALAATVQSFDELNDPQYLNRQPERVRVKQVGGATTLQAFLQQNGTPADRMNELAILNGMELGAQLPSGTLVKTVSR